jgi:hypothetical protein
MEKQACEYKLCLKEATTKGFVLVWGKEGKYIPEPVWACDKHKKVSGFFEDK